MMPRRILFVDDEPALRSAIAEVLAGAGHIITEVATAAAAWDAFVEDRYEVVVTDLRLPDGCGIDLLSRLRALDTKFTAIVTTGYGTYEQAVEAIRLRVGAFLTKPFSPAELVKIIAEIDPLETAAAANEGFNASAEATERAVLGLTQQIETELDRLQTQPWVRARSLELLCEALENTMCHAYPGTRGDVRVGVRRDGDGLLLQVEDHGCGFDVSAALSGALAPRESSKRPDALPGLIKFHKCADEVRLDSEPGRGTRVQLRFRNAFDSESLEFMEPSDDDLAVACLWS
ncbi:MAG: response regulator [Planctomycetes bacterium]|nr:response regulator [Planctomycetota bacterium]